MDHPSRGPGSEQSAGSFRRCRPGDRCGVCRTLEGQKRRERALFRAILTQDGELQAELDRLVELFYDAAQEAPVADRAAS